VATVVSVNVGPVRTLEWGGKRVRTAFCKDPVQAGVRVSHEGLAGDGRAYRAAIGNPDHAVHAYAAEDLSWWAGQEQRPFPPGILGENLTLCGVDVTAALIGERWRIADVVLEICQPRRPCVKMGMRLADPSFLGRFEAAARPGAYLRVLAPGTITPGDSVDVIARPAHGLSIGEVFAARAGRRELVPKLLTAPELTPKLRRWAQEQVAAGGA
jgi:MOSC domain-containing protein YiiM